jgi:chromosome segregation ATPase
VTKEFRELTENYKRQELTIKTMSDQLKAQKSSSDKEIAILTQKLGFAEENLREAKQQLVEAKANYEATVAAMEEANGRMKEENENERIAELKNKFALDMKNAEIDWENMRKKIQFDLDTIGKTKNEL